MVKRKTYLDLEFLIQANKNWPPIKKLTVDVLCKPYKLGSLSHHTKIRKKDCKENEGVIKIAPFFQE